MICDSVFISDSHNAGNHVQSEEQCTETAVNYCSDCEVVRCVTCTRQCVAAGHEIGAIQ